MDAIDPIRWFDTRTSADAPKLRAGHPRRFVLPSELGDPTEVVLNITCVDPEAAGWVRAWSGVEPPTSNVNFRVGHTICNTAHLKVRPDRTIAFRANRWVHLVVDVQAAGASQLVDRVILAGVRLEPVAAVSGPDSGVIRTWNRFGGLLTELAGEIDIEPEAAAAVLTIESSGTGMTAHGPVIRFENHVFFDRWGRSNPAAFDDHFRPRTGSLDHMWRPTTAEPFRPVHIGSQDSEWEVYTFGRSLDPAAATESISIGLAQIMGFNARRVGYDSAEQMLAAFSDPTTGVASQIVGFFDFVVAADLGEAIRAHDWDRFAIVYNGAAPGSDKMREYSSRMQSAYDELRAAR